jgi:hypothetical protein
LKLTKEKKDQILVQCNQLMKKLQKINLFKEMQKQIEMFRK